MEFPEKRRLFTIKEMTQACGISRSTLLRMEEDGFLTPYRVDPKTGYRYYDLQNVTAVGQYQRLVASGLTRKEIADLYYERVDSRKFLEAQRHKLSSLQRFLNEYELRHDKSKNYSISHVTLPAVTCYCADIRGSSFEEKELQSYLAHEKCVEAGYRMLGSEPIMLIYDDIHSCIDQLNPDYISTECIPVNPDSHNSDTDPNLRFFPATEALTILGFGYYTVVPSLWSRLFEEMKRQGLEPSGPLRLIGLIAPYTGAHYKSEDFCYECVVPIRKKKDLSGNSYDNAL